MRILFSIKPLATLLCPSPTKFRFYSTIDAATTAARSAKDASDVLRHWGCTGADIHRIFTRSPTLRNVDPVNLESKLGLLRGLGLKPSDLVTIIHRHPRFLAYRMNRYFDEPPDCLESFFGSREMLIKAIVSNPSLLIYDFQKTVTPVVEMYAEVGVGKSDFISLLLSRPTLIPRSRLCEEKIDYISKTAVPRESKMYKHLVAIMAISRVETIREKLTHLQKFGFSEDEILGAIGRSPLLLTLSTDKVQRNMTFVVGTIKLPAKVVLDKPFLLYHNLENTLKPRMSLACKIDEMDLVPRIKGPAILRALRMEEKRFIKAFVTCHPPDVSEELMGFYRNAKGVKKLAVSSKMNLNKGFPFWNRLKTC